MKIAKLAGVKEFIAKSKSPSCGCGLTYDGTFFVKLIKGDGVTAALRKNGIRIINETEYFYAETSLYNQFPKPRKRKKLSASSK